MPRHLVPDALVGYQGKPTPDGVAAESPANLGTTATTAKRYPASLYALWSFFLSGGFSMLPMIAVREALGTLLAADATTLAPAVNANKVALFMNNVAVTENLVAGDLTPATFTGSTPIAGATGAQQTGIDPVTQEQIVTIKEPVGGWRWATTNTVNLPQTIYGFALYDSTLATLLGAALLPAPITLTAAGQEINLGAVQMRFVLRPLS